MRFCVEEGKGKEIHTLDIAPLRETLPQKRSGMARVFEVSDSFISTPTRSYAIGMSHTSKPYQIRLRIDM